MITKTRPLRLLLLTMISVAVVASWWTAARAMPIEKDPVRSAILPVADGCGFNKYRDARGICRRKYVFRPHQGKRQFYGACTGLDAHRVCNLTGQCWTECN